MGMVMRPMGHIVCVCVMAVAVLSAGLVTGTGAGLAWAQSYESMMPASLLREVHKAEAAYRDIMDAVNAAESERLARQAAGAAGTELRELDNKVGALVTKAEKAQGPGRLPARNSTKTKRPNTRASRPAPATAGNRKCLGCSGRHRPGARPAQAAGEIEPAVHKVAAVVGKRLLGPGRDVPGPDPLRSGTPGAA